MRGFSLPLIAILLLILSFLHTNVADSLHQRRIENESKKKKKKKEKRILAQALSPVPQPFRQRIIHVDCFFALQESNKVSSSQKLPFFP